MRTLENKSKLTALGAATLVAVAFALIVGTHQVGATPPTGGGSAGSSNNAFAVGGITTADGHVAFAAHQNPKNPLSYNGYVVQDTMMVSRSGPVDCVFISGNKARVIWTIKNSDTPSEIGTQRQFDVEDNGEPTMGMPMDLYMDLGSCDNDPWTNTPDCDCSKSCGGGPMILKGNIVIKGPS